MRRASLLWWLPLGGLLLSCGGGAGGLVRPKDFKGADALGGGAVCTGAAKFARPLTVDLDPDTRGDIEASMKQGVVVVAYDCVNLRVLSNCHAPNGSYEYAGVSRKEEVVQMKGLDELKVNLPLGAAKLSSEVQAGRTIDLALVSVGRRSTTLSALDRAELTGGCEGATHYMQKASVGAFSLATGSNGKVAGVADMFGKSASGSSTEERSSTRTDGSLEACRTSDPDAEKPPSECRAPLRVELIPIRESATAAAAAPPPPASGAGVEVQENACPEGFKVIEGVCSNKLDVAFLCDPKNEQECRQQCEKGNAGSCANVGALIANTYWKITWAKARDDARPFFKKACDADDLVGCAGYVRTTFPSEKDIKGKLAEAKPLLALDKKACAAGVGMACFDLGTYTGAVYEGQPFTDIKASLGYFERSCKLGHPDACNTAGLLHMSVDPAKGLALYERGCDGGDGFVCNQLAMRLITGMDATKKDLPRGERLTRRACDLNIENCGFTSELLTKAGKTADAFKFAKQGCEGKDPRTGLDEGDLGRAQQYRGAACKELGDIHAEGRGVTKDAAKAKGYYTTGCNFGDRRACWILKQ